MTAEFIKNFIDVECQDFDLIVLKGFSPNLIVELGKTFDLLDGYAIVDDKIVLENINETQLMLSIICHTSSVKALCTCESLIKMCTQITGLGILQKKICVLDNNMLELYPNPSNADIPDFDSESFMDTDNDSALYSLFYSFCICENGEQRVQYIYNYVDSDSSCVTIKRLIEPKDNVIF